MDIPGHISCSPFQVLLYHHQGSNVKRTGFQLRLERDFDLSGHDYFSFDYCFEKF
jgi:hypothetical protein